MLPNAIRATYVRGRHSRCRCYRRECRRTQRRTWLDEYRRCRPTSRKRSGRDKGCRGGLQTRRYFYRNCCCYRPFSSLLGLSLPSPHVRELS